MSRRTSGGDCEARASEGRAASRRLARLRRTLWRKPLSETVYRERRSAKALTKYLCRIWALRFRNFASRRSTSSTARAARRSRQKFRHNSTRGGHHAFPGKDGAGHRRGIGMSFKPSQRAPLTSLSSRPPRPLTRPARSRRRLVPSCRYTRPTSDVSVLSLRASAAAFACVWRAKAPAA